MVKHGCTSSFRNLFCCFSIEDIVGQMSRAAFSSNRQYQKCVQNRLCLAFVGTTTSFGPQRLHTAHWERLPPTDGMGSVIRGGDRGVVFACLVDGTYSVSLSGSRFCLLNFLELPMAAFISWEQRILDLLHIDASWIKYFGMFYKESLV